jgi:nickel/cobalt exporter
MIERRVLRVVDRAREPASSPTPFSISTSAACRRVDVGRRRLVILGRGARPGRVIEVKLAWSRFVPLTFRLRPALVIFFLWACAGAVPAGAHPLGNFTINHLSKVAFDARGVSLRYILDMAEIPTYQLMREQSPSGRMSGEQLARWAVSQGNVLSSQLAFSVDARPVRLSLDSATARTRPGAGGLPILYLVALYHGSTTIKGAHTIRYSDGTYPGRLGWKDVVMAPGSEPTHELTAYPSALLGSPRSLTAVEIAASAGGSLAVRAVDGETSSNGAVMTAAPSAVRSNQLSDMLARGTGDWGFVALTFLVAIALGALHALEPGHGKTLLAISLVGARATVKQAAILAGALTVAHTIGVLALGFAIELFKGAFVPETIYPWITLVSGALIAVIGARAIERQLRLQRPFAHAHAHGHSHAHAHAHPHVHHPHAHHAHGHEHGPGHTHTHAQHDAHGNDHEHSHDDLDHARLHAIPGSAPLRFGPTIWAAMSGGIAPCPAALVVLLAATALDQVTYGILVIVAFSAGLAATLTGLGIAVVRGAGWLRDRPAFRDDGPLRTAGVGPRDLRDRRGHGRPRLCPTRCRGVAPNDQRDHRARHRRLRVFASVCPRARGRGA